LRTQITYEKTNLNKTKKKYIRAEIKTESRSIQYVITFFSPLYSTVPSLACVKGGDHGRAWGGKKIAPANNLAP
jgi:hypothetical protein